MPSSSRSCAGPPRRRAPSPGCRSYDVAETLDGADEFVVVHAWADEAALEAHYRGAAHQAYQHDVFGLLARPSELDIHRVAATERPVDWA